MFKEINNVVFNVNNITKIRIEKDQVVIFTTDQDVQRIYLDKNGHEFLLDMLINKIENYETKYIDVNDLNNFMYEVDVGNKND